MWQTLANDFNDWSFLNNTFVAYLLLYERKFFSLNLQAQYSGPLCKSNISNGGVKESTSMQGSLKIKKWLTPCTSDPFCLCWYFLSCLLVYLVLDPSLSYSFIFLFNLLNHFLTTIFSWYVAALLEFNQSVLVSRKDPESRKKAVAQVTERLTSKGYWPQVRRLIGAESFGSI